MNYVVSSFYSLIQASAAQSRKHSNLCINDKIWFSWHIFQLDKGNIWYILKILLIHFCPDRWIEYSLYNNPAAWSYCLNVCFVDLLYLVVRNGLEAGPTSLNQNPLLNQVWTPKWSGGPCRPPWYPPWIPHWDLLESNSANKWTWWHPTGAKEVRKEGGLEGMISSHPLASESPLWNSDQGGQDSYIFTWKVFGKLFLESMQI